MGKSISTDHPVHQLIAERWSPYAFSERPVAEADLRSLLEAARWAASSYNEQPWSFIVATKDRAEEFEAVLSCLVEPNQAWAQATPVLMLCCSSTEFSRNGKPNGSAIHDLGLAAGNICLEATARGLSVHQMAGILPDRARALFAIPDSVQVVTAMAIGYAAPPSDPPSEFHDRDAAARQRKRLSQFVFGKRWGISSDIV